MRETREVIVDKKEIQLVSITCDRCHVTFGSLNEFNGNSECYAVNRFKFEWEKGFCYPEGRFTETKFIEICAECRPRFLEELASMGIIVQAKDTSD